MITTLMPLPKQQFLNNNGLPLVNGSVYTYAAGTSVLKDTYTDEDGTTPQPNPIPLNVRGEPNVPIRWSGAYRVEVLDHLGNLIYTVDDFNTDPAGLWMLTWTLLTAVGASMIGFIAAGVGAILRTVQAKLRENGSVFDYGVVGDGVTDDTIAYGKAIAAVKNLYHGDSNTIIRITTKRTYNIANQRNFGQAKLLFDGTSATRLGDVTANNVMFEGLTFSGNLKQPSAGLMYVASNVVRPRFHSCAFIDILSSETGTSLLNQTYALLMSPYGITDFEVIDCQFKNIRKYNNGAYVPVAVGLGFTGGICFLEDTMAVPVAAQPTPTRGLVHGCVFDTIQTILAGGLSDNDVAIYDDADAIRSYGQTGGAEQLQVKVSDCTFIQCSKRACKLLASRGEIDNIRIFADGMTYGMVNPIYISNNCSVRGVKIYASVAKPVILAVQYIVNGEAQNRQALIDNIFISHCVTGVGFGGLDAASTLENVMIRNVFINQALIYGLVQTTPQPVTQRNLFYDNINIFGSGNVCTGVLVGGAADGTGGGTYKNITVSNGSINIGGVTNSVEGIRQDITSNTFVGPSAAARLFRFGQNGLGGYQNVRNVFINASGINTAFLSVGRPSAILFLGDNADYRDIRIKYPDAMTQAFDHFEFYGSDWVLDGFTFDSPGVGQIGTTVASVRWSVKNAKRLGNGASTSAFFYTSNAGTGNGQFENIVDFRPTTANSITINAGLGVGNRFVVFNVASKTSNGTIVASGGLATVVNAIYFP